MKGTQVLILLLVVLAAVVVRLERWYELVRRAMPVSGPGARSARWRAFVRFVLLRLNPPRVPRDPFRLTSVVRVDPYGDGRPGETFLAPAPDTRRGLPGLASDGSRQDVIVPLARGVRLYVVCFGRVGELHGSEVLLPAAARVARQMQRGLVPGAMVLDERPYSGPMGEGRRIAWRLPRGSQLVDVHVDRGGWAFGAGVLSGHDHDRYLAVSEAILRTWKWLDPDPVRLPSTASDA